MVLRPRAVLLKLFLQPSAKAEDLWIKCPQGFGRLAQCGEISSKSCAIILYLYSCKTLVDELSSSRIAAS